MNENDTITGNEAQNDALTRENINNKELNDNWCTSLRFKIIDKCRI